MKKIKPEVARKRTRIKQKLWKKRKLRESKIRKFGRVPKEIKLELPTKFSFESVSDFNETMRNLQKFKNLTVSKNASIMNLNVYVDFTTVKDISLDAALVLAAEIDRWRQLKGIKLVPRELNKWNVKVKRYLGAFGFFKLLDVHDQVSIDSENYDDNFVPLDFKSNHINKFDHPGQYLSRIVNKIPKEFLDDESKSNIFAAIYESVYNVQSHAYPKPDKSLPYFRKPKYIYPHIGMFWITACWYPEKSVLRCMTYDQGVGIPKSLPLKGFGENFRRSFKGLSDSDIIELATKLSRTSVTIPGGRGEGLAEIVNIVDNYEGSEVRITSGKGQFVKNYNGRVDKFDYDYHIGGTLIEWYLPLKKIKSMGEER